MLSSLIQFSYLFTLVFFFFSATQIQGKPYEQLFKPFFERPRSSIKGIDSVYIINLDARPEKWHRLEPLLYYHGVLSNLFSAVNGWDFSINTIKKFCTRHMRLGQLGCMLSHLSIYHDALQRGLKVIWVAEDDLEILRDPKLLTPIIAELDQLDPEWDILYTDLDFVKGDGTFAKSCGFPREKKYPFPHPLDYYTYRNNISENIQIVRSRYGTGSMIVSEKGMKKVLKHFTTSDDILWPIDIEIHYVPGIRQYGIIDPIATNGHFTFNISDTCKTSVKNYYEIDDEHVKYMEGRRAYFEDIFKNWLTIFPIPNQPQTQ